MNHGTPKYIRDWLRMGVSLRNILQFTGKLLNDTNGGIIQFEYQKVLHNFIQRLHLNFTTINNSWKWYLTNSQFKYPFYLMLRSLISDFIIMLYLLDGLKINRKARKIDETGFKTRYIEISNSYFTKINRELQNLVANKKISPKKMEKFLTNERNFYPEQFEQGQKAIVKKMRDLPIGAIVKILNGTKMKKYMAIYSQYIYFSQYEHFTAKTEDINRNKRDEEFEVLTYVVDFLLVGLLMNISKMGFNNIYIEELEKISNDFKNRFVK